MVTIVLTSGGHPPTPATAQGIVRLDVNIGKSQVIDLKEPFTRASVTNPNIADVFVITPTQILINGKAVGVTSLVVFYTNKTLFFDLVVQIDTALLMERIREIAPREEIQVTPAQDALIISGKVSSEQMVAGIAEVASLFAPKGKVVNLLTVTGAKPLQVLLQVHVAEVAREALRELGFSIRALGSTLQGATFPGNPFTVPLGVLGVVSATGEPTGRGVGGTSAGGPDFLFSAADFFISSGRRDYAGIVRALAERNLARTLAKPNLVTLSGTEAKFLSGGEFPIPVSQEFGRVTIQFKEFGILLKFTPVVEGETINLKVRPEVSSLDFQQGLELSGFRIPAILKNEASTTISLKDGESFAIAGLIKNEVRQTVAKIPLLGDIPVLGALFRSSRFQHNETELLFLVTVKLVQAPPTGSPGVPDPGKLMEPREAEKKEFTLVPGIPGVGEVVERPLGSSNLESK
ncbi:MAG TPA: type II and III secretion system protein family protein [Methylomirabilota bacterium]|nr:type II and III secretion system protein family protein [Methylomirabilota bacterium]